MTRLDALALQCRDAKGALRLKVREAAAALEALRGEVERGEPLSLHRVRVKLDAVEEAAKIARATEAAELRAVVAQAGAW